MNQNEPVIPLEECLAYITKSAWQFKHLEPDSRVTVSAKMLRSFYWHLAMKVPEWTPPPELGCDESNRLLCQGALQLPPQSGGDEEEPLDERGFPLRSGDAA